MAAVSPRVVKFDFLLNLMKCRPHVMVCLNLVHNEAEEEFSLLEMTEAFFWSVIISENFSLKYHQCCFFCLFVFNKVKARIFPSLLSVTFFFFSPGSCCASSVLLYRVLADTAARRPSFKLVPLYITNDHSVETSTIKPYLMSW